jgi:hypothetical protein
MMLFAQNAGYKHKFLSILLKAEMFFAKLALMLKKLQQQRDKYFLE